MKNIRHPITDETKKRMNYIKLFEAFSPRSAFIYNIEKQGWISSRQMVVIGEMYRKAKDAVTPRKGVRYKDIDAWQDIYEYCDACESDLY